MNDPAHHLASLHRVLDGLDTVAVAASGGVDSLTLAHAAHARLGGRATMYHAVSPAVPPEATERTRGLASTHGWSLVVIDAGEFEDPDYLRNPVDRCFHCKTNLYAAIARHTRATIASGTNLDDLSDYRPGLVAARNHGVRHPYVEAAIDKRGVRALARALGLAEVAELPAAPCLSSRLETGTRVTAPTLALVHRVETLVRRELAAAVVRARVRREGLVVEVDDATFARLGTNGLSTLLGSLSQTLQGTGFEDRVRLDRYRMGSAFLRST